MATRSIILLVIYDALLVVSRFWLRTYISYPYTLALIVSACP